MDSNNIQPTAKYRPAVATRGSWWKVDDDYLTSIGYDTTSGEGKYAQLVYSINSSSTSGSSGDGTIIDGDNSDIKATVFELANSNPLATTIVDLSGDQITSFGSSAIAVSGVPTESLDGDAVDPWYDTYGRQVIFGANMSLNAIDVNNISDSLTARYGPYTNMDSVSGDSTGSIVSMSSYHNITIHIKAENVTSGATVNVEHSMTAESDEWVNVSSNSISTSGMSEIAISNVAYQYIRTTVSDYTDGVYTTMILAGN